MEDGRSRLGQRAESNLRRSSRGTVMIALAARLALLAGCAALLLGRCA
jgi:hypothetical protein